MKNLTVELKKCKRTGILVVLPLVGLLGALYAFVNFIVRKEVLLSLPLPPMDVLLTQLYGMVMVLNMFGIIVATTLTYNMEFQGNAIKKMYMLPFKTSSIFKNKFYILFFIFHLNFNTFYNIIFILKHYFYIIIYLTIKYILRKSTYSLSYIF